MNSQHIPPTRYVRHYDKGLIHKIEIVNNIFSYFLRPAHMAVSAPDSYGLMSYFEQLLKDDGFVSIHQEDAEHAHLHADECDSQNGEFHFHLKHQHHKKITPELEEKIYKLAQKAMDFATPRLELCRLNKPWTRKIMESLNIVPKRLCDPQIIDYKNFPPLVSALTEAPECAKGRVIRDGVGVSGQYTQHAECFQPHKNLAGRGLFHQPEPLSVLSREQEIGMASILSLFVLFAAAAFSVFLVCRKKFSTNNNTRVALVAQSTIKKHKFK